jgi:hypothetical protein
MTLSPTSTFLDVFNNYICSLKNQNKGNHTERMLKSALLRFFVPAVGGPIPKSSRTDAIEVHTGLEFLKTLPPQKISEVCTVAEQEFEAKGTDKGIRRRLRSYLKQFSDWAVERGYCEKIKRKQQFEYERLHAAPGQARKDWKNGTLYGRSKKDVYQLCAKRFPGDYINPALQEEIEKYELFRREGGCMPSTIKSEITRIKHLLGWLHRYKEAPLDELRLSSIMFFSPLNVTLKSCDDDISRQIIEKAKAREAAIEKAKANMPLIKAFLDFQDNHPNTHIAILDVLIAIGKFLYQYEIGTDDYPEPRDIPIIRRVMEEKKKLKNEAKVTPSFVQHYQKSIPWEVALEVVEKLRIRFEREFQYSMTKRNGLQTRKRTEYALERDLQDFLSVAFLVLIPPDRSRTYCELELGKTLIFGSWRASQFIPAESMENSLAARWYIHLGPTDYKTGKAYGEYWCELPNIQYEDGKTFYGYIERWLTWGRDNREIINHDYFFRAGKKFRPITHKDWASRIKYIFDRETGVAVSPKEFRKMYVTYINEQGVTDEIKEASACAQHHSRKMQSQIYDQQSKMKKAMPALKFTEETAKKVFSRMHTQRQKETD